MLGVIKATTVNRIGAGAGKTQVFMAAAGPFKLKTSPTQRFFLLISNNSKCEVAKRSSTNKALVFKGDVNKSCRNFSSWKKKIGRKILHYPIKKILEEVCKVSVEGKPIRLPVPMFRSGSKKLSKQ